MTHITETTTPTEIHTVVTQGGTVVYENRRPQMSVVNGKIHPPTDPVHQQAMEFWRKEERAFLKRGAKALIDAVSMYLYGRKIGHYKVGMRTNAIFDGLGRLCAFSDPDFITRQNPTELFQAYATYDLGGGQLAQFDTLNLNPDL